MTTPNITATAEVVDGKVTNITVTSSGGGYRRPQRIQRKRTKGWRMPPNTVCVDRPSKWGNPFRVEPPARESEYVVAVNRFRSALLFGNLSITTDDVRRELRGVDVAAWCKPNQPCHADVLLEVANS